MLGSLQPITTSRIEPAGGREPSCLTAPLPPTARSRSSLMSASSGPPSDSAGAAAGRAKCVGRRRLPERIRGRVPLPARLGRDTPPSAFALRELQERVRRHARRLVVVQCEHVIRSVGRLVLGESGRRQTLSSYQAAYEHGRSAAEPRRRALAGDGSRFAHAPHELGDRPRHKLRVVGHRDVAEPWQLNPLGIRKQVSQALGVAR